MACITPFYVQQDSDYIPVPCGKCPPCKKRRVSGWSFRLTKQAGGSTSALFVTLTYNTDNVPITENGYMTLVKTGEKSVTNFLKRLRKISTEKLKYYYCGEYGGKTNRPHYHMILFNAKPADVEATWKLGSVHYGDVNGASVGYTLKYMSKQGRIPMHKNDDRQPEFSNMSKGLGADYLTPNMIKYHTADVENRVCITIEDGKKIAMPRYYKDKIYTDRQKADIAIKARYENEQRQLEKEKEQYLLHGDRAREVEIQVHKDLFNKMHNDAEKNRDKI